MGYKTIDIYNALMAVRDFGANNAADVPAASKAGRNFAVVAASVREMETSGAVKESGAARSSVVSKDNAVAAVMENWRAVNRTARGIAVDKPEVLPLFRMPTGDNIEELIEETEAGHINVTRFKDDFLESNMPADFVEDWRADLDALKQSITGKNAATGAKVGATAAKGSAAQEGLKALRRLRGIVPNIYADDPAKLAEWESASHIRRSKRAAEDAKKEADEENDGEPDTPPNP